MIVHKLLPAFLIAAAALAAAPARAADLTIYSGGAVQNALAEVATLYEKKSGSKLDISYMPMGPLMQKLGEGAAPDLVVLSDDRMAAATKSATVDAASITDIGRVAIGVAVNAKAPYPDISTPEALKQALLSAKSIVYIDPARGTSGAYVAKMIEQLGIADAVKAKTTLGSGGYVIEPVGHGEIELGIHQITEILPVEGAKLVGPLPAPLQKETLYQGAALAASPRKAQGRAFLAFAASPEMRQVFVAKGFLEKP
ncbi:MULTISPECIES: substrate-binding domain-containing protein [Rhodomicrobium]|uniref:molybdate ABC transporter substrate-binding protein n=1 Tax=Rhodomicrobium TaxID=1068 RepID=UPI000B4ACEF6|nr:MULTISPECIES: substrate-binding domain-containing protein [Rhodomicrobium]